jgi:hypothetical protein
MFDEMVSFVGFSSFFFVRLPAAVGHQVVGNSMVKGRHNAITITKKIEDRKIKKELLIE